MTFAEARKFPMPFGKCIGKTLDEIAETDQGLQYLDWFRGQKMYGQIAVAVKIYLSDVTIENELNRVINK